MKNAFKFSALSALMISMPAFAANHAKHLIIAPTCLLEHASLNYQTLAKDSKLTLIQTTERGVDALASAKTHGKTPCGQFMDVTDAWHSSNNVTANKFLKHYTTAPNTTLARDISKKEIKYQSQVNQLLKTVNPQAMWANLSKLSSHENRYARSDEGVKVAAWIKSQLESMAKEYNHDDVTTYYVQTGGSFKQPSVVVKFGNSNKSGIVIGAHMDTLNSTWERKPGADDDGSGSVVVMETARALLASGMHFDNPIYFIWYAAEEQGLVGSQRVVADFKQKHIPVSAVVHFDMTGYAYRNNPTMWLMDDYTNPALTSYMSKLITTYVKQPVKHSRCGYACSDHASWTQAGFPASIPAEAAYENTNPALHTSRDTMDRLSLDHMTDYAKLAIAASVEFAEPISE